LKVSDILLMLVPRSVDCCVKDILRNLAMIWKTTKSRTDSEFRFIKQVSVCG
jgi:hypothetical protein